MITSKLSQADICWERLTFPSTLYLYPILDLLIQGVHWSLQDQIRLGLQEALVNAATHGNQLQPHKLISVDYCQANRRYCWIISDQGEGVDRLSCCAQVNLKNPGYVGQWFPPDESEDGRGLGILAQIFDQVHWNANGTSLHLNKKAPEFSQRLLHRLHYHTSHG